MTRVFENKFVNGVMDSFYTGKIAKGLRQELWDRMEAWLRQKPDR